MPKFAMSLATWAEGMRQRASPGRSCEVQGVPVGVWEGLLLQELDSLVHLQRHKACHRDIKVRRL